MSPDILLRAARDNYLAGEWDIGLKQAGVALNSVPDRPDALFLVSQFLRQIGYPAMARCLMEKALSQDQQQPTLWQEYGCTLHDLHRYEPAIEALKVAHTMWPKESGPLSNMAAAYTQLGKWRDAINLCNQALALKPDDYIAHSCAGFCNLALGRWADGWKHSTYLYGTHINTRTYGHDEPEWDGSPGLSVVVNADQGLGDQIMFSQCIPELIRDSKCVIVECSDRMVSYFRHNFPGVTVYGTLKQQSGVEWPSHEAIDARVHLSALGRFYRKADKAFTRQAYISPDADRLVRWRDWLSQFPGRTIGVAWHGGIQPTQEHLRSISLEQFAPILNRPGTFFDLSYHDSSAEVARWNLSNPATQIVRPPLDTQDYQDTIAFVAALDSVVCVTTSIAHACGALGRSAFVLTPSVPQWRYAYRSGNAPIWYAEDSIELIRQVAGETDWGPAIKRAADRLA